MKMMMIAVTLVCAALLLASAVDAQEKHVMKISFKLVVIHASGAGEEVDIDPDLKDLKDALTATGHKKFRLLKARDYSYPEWTQFGEPLKEGYQLTMVTRWLDKGTPGVQVSVTHEKNKRKPIIKATVPLKPAKPQLVDGPKLSDGQLILCFIRAK